MTLSGLQDPAMSPSVIENHLKKFSPFIKLYCENQNYMNPHTFSTFFSTYKPTTKIKELNFHLRNRFKLIWESKERLLFLHLKHYKWQISTPQ